jgi:hypothetical protein
LYQGTVPFEDFIDLCIDAISSLKDQRINFQKPLVNIDKPVIIISVTMVTFWLKLLMNFFGAGL